VLRLLPVRVVATFHFHSPLSALPPIKLSHNYVFHLVRSRAAPLILFKQHCPTIIVLARAAHPESQYLARPPSHSTTLPEPQHRPSHTSAPLTYNLRQRTSASTPNNFSLSHFLIKWPARSAVRKLRFTEHRAVSHQQLSSLTLSADMRHCRREAPGASHGRRGWNGQAHSS
jgi:hypothetical protein